MLGEVLVLVSCLFLSPVTSEGVKWLISLWSGSPNRRLQVTPAYHYFTWLLQANGEPYLTQGESILMINLREASGLHHP